jgi:hypothetical protein
MPLSASGQAEMEKTNFAYARMAFSGAQLVQVIPVEGFRFPLVFATLWRFESTLGLVAGRETRFKGC